jgi:hypothetical protein
MKLELKRRRFQSIEEIQAQLQDVMKTLTESGFHNRF